MSQFEADIRIRSFQVDINKNLSIPSLLGINQERAIHHTEMLGYGKEKTLDKGYLWIITAQHFHIERLPVYDEKIKIITYPGKQRSFFLPRYLEIVDQNGNRLVKGTTLWALIKKENRKILEPSDIGIVIQGEEKGTEIPPFFSLPKEDTSDQRFYRKADYSNCDLNGHINNTRYAEECLRHIPNDIVRNYPIKEIGAKYRKEVRLGEKFLVHSSSKDKTYFFKSCPFSLRLCF